jgi:hypothetical protein
MIDKARELSVVNLQRLYAIVMSLAIAESLRRLLSDYGNSGSLPAFASSVAVVSLLITAVPYFHGANRYLEAMYITGESQVNSGTLMVDFVALFVEGLIFFVLAVVIDQTRVFVTILALLFLFSSVWIGVRYVAAIKGRKPPVIVSWPIANLVAAICLLTLVWSELPRWSPWPPAIFMSVALGVTSLARTVYDYYSGWDFYMPSSKTGGSPHSSRASKRRSRS